MGIDIKVPTLGESVSTATVARWLKKTGESVAADEPLVELETDKVTVEVPAPQAGVLGAIQAEEGAEVEVGTVLGTVEEGSGKAKAPTTAANPGSGVNAPPAPRGPVSRPAVEAPKPAPTPISGTSHEPMPSAAKMMQERGVQQNATRRKRQGWPHHQGRRSRLPVPPGSGNDLGDTSSTAGACAD